MKINPFIMKAVEDKYSFVLSPKESVSCRISLCTFCIVFEPLSKHSFVSINPMIRTFIYAITVCACNA